MVFKMKNNIKSGIELIIVETDAYISHPNGKLKGKLILTTKNLVFSSKDTKVNKSFKLKLIQSVYIFKAWFFNEGLHLVYKNEIFKIFVGYPADWVKLIESRQQIVKLRQEII